MDPLRRDAVPGQVGLEPVGAVLGAGEYECLLHQVALKQREEEHRLELLRHRVDRLGDPDGRRGLPLETDGRRVPEHLAGERDDRGGHRGAEEERLPARRQVAQHAPDVGQEAHVEHPVGLVQHEVLDAGELCVGGPEVVEQPARRRDQHVHPGPERVLLRPHPDAAEDRRAGDGGVHGELVQLLENLRRQLARRREHQRAGGAAALIDEAMQDRQQEGGGLAAARHGGGQHVPPFERGRNGIHLDGRGAGEAELLDALQETRVELEATERHGAVSRRRPRSRPTGGGRGRVPRPACRRPAPSRAGACPRS